MKTNDTTPPVRAWLEGKTWSAHHDDVPGAYGIGDTEELARADLDVAIATLKLHELEARSGRPTSSLRERLRRLVASTIRDYVDIGALKRAGYDLDARLGELVDELLGAEGRGPMRTKERRAWEAALRGPHGRRIQRRADELAVWRLHDVARLVNAACALEVGHLGDSSTRSSAAEWREAARLFFGPWAEARSARMVVFMGLVGALRDGDEPKSGARVQEFKLWWKACRSMGLLDDDCRPTAKLSGYLLRAAKVSRGELIELLAEEEKLPVFFRPLPRFTGAQVRARDAARIEFQATIDAETRFTKAGRRR